MTQIDRNLSPGEFYGDVARSLRVADAQFSLVTHPHAREVPLHRHEAAYLCLLLDGSYAESYKGVTTTYRPFMVAFHPPRYEHSDSIGERGAAFFLIELGNAWIQRVAELVDLREVKVELRGNDLVWLTMRLFREFNDFDEESTNHAESLLYELIASAARLPDIGVGDSGWLRRATDLLDGRFTELLTVAQIAEHAGVHPVTLARGFREAYQQTVSEYVNRLRVRHACELILRDVPIAAASVDCGFIDQSYFTKVFKSITGTTPAAFRCAVRTSIYP
jgi:AraC family transcriptional regulator